MGDRLKNARGSFMNNNAVWEAHKLRNRLAHEQNVQLNSFSVDQALKGFKAGLKDLGAL
jgi:transposase